MEERAVIAGEGIMTMKIRRGRRREERRGEVGSRVVRLGDRWRTEYNEGSMPRKYDEDSDYAEDWNEKK